MATSASSRSEPARAAERVGGAEHEAARRLRLGQRDVSMGQMWGRRCQILCSLGLLCGALRCNSKTTRNGSDSEPSTSATSDAGGAAGESSGAGATGGSEGNSSGHGSGGASASGGAASGGGGRVASSSSGGTSTNDSCGDGELQAGEACDDGNTLPGDGCNASCQIEATGCPPEGCTISAACGDALLQAGEACDDGNAKASDGCSADCSTVEVGWACRVPGRPCLPICGDGLLTGNETCEDNNRVGGDGCSSTCLTEPGWFCEGSICRQAECGNGKREAGEACDAGTMNGLFFGDGSGCSTTCTPEPTCRDANGVTGACSTACGDGNVDAGEACDDGNGVDGDGCSSSCQMEDGFTCATLEQTNTQPCAGGSCLVLPIVFRDFDGEQAAGGHPDFYYMSTTRPCVPNASGHPDPTTDDSCWSSDSTELCQGITAPELGPEGKPSLGDTTSCHCRYTDWEPGGLLATGTTCDSGSAQQPRRIDTMVDVVDSAQSFAQWFNDDPAVNSTVRSTLELRQIASGVFQFSSSGGKTVYDDLAKGAGTTLVSGFFPLEDQARSKVCNIWPYWIAENSDCDAEADELPSEQWDPSLNDGNGGGVSPVTGIERNFYFTSELRYLFRFAGGERVSFSGDDDVFLFVNGKIVLDMGAPHERLAGEVQLPTPQEGASGTATWTISSIDPVSGTTSTVGSGSSAPLGLSEGSVYELAVFHADRHPRESNYQLTLQAFSNRRSECTPTCGDGVVTSGEECDDGANDDDTVYGGCTSQCTFGPYCGDAVVDADHEECDDGENNNAQYGEAGCTPRCTVSRFCGDGRVDTTFGEQCDEGVDNGQELCNADCSLRVN